MAKDWEDLVVAELKAGRYKGLPAGRRPECYREIEDKICSVDKPAAATADAERRSLTALTALKKLQVALITGGGNGLGGAISMLEAL